MSTASSHAKRNWAHLAAAICWSLACIIQATTAVIAFSVEHRAPGNFAVVLSLLFLVLAILSFRAFGRSGR